MGPSPAKPSPAPSEGVTCYGVYVPPDVQASSEDNVGVFYDKSEALKVVKKYKKARFKPFRSESEAMQFAIFGMEGQNECTHPPAESGEKPSPFRGPKPQDMVRFRKAIESGDIDFVKKTVWENPRFLVSSGDTPSILQEGSRYNALHISARSRDANICAFILQTVSSYEFMRHFYGDSTDVDQRCTVLLDLYLNTPDKALNETPLHFATKFGAVHVVRVLVAYQQCDRTATNKFNQTAKDVVCSRMTGADPALKEEITNMLNEQFYVPVLRSPDTCIEPVVGELMSPSSPLNQRRGRDALSPQLEVQAVAGPMPRQTAELFRRRWKTPPRQSGSPLRVCRATLLDQDKGWEKIGRELAQEWKVPWKEYWPFLNTYIDLSSTEGLQLLEDFLHKRFKNTADSPITSTPTSTTTITLQSPTPPAESPVSELCSALRACRLSSGGNKPAVRHPPPRHHPQPQPQMFHNGDARHTGSDQQLPVNITDPHLYMEKSCQIFAKRIADGLHMCEELEFLWTEVRHLNTLVISCKVDRRFLQLGQHLQHLHSRLSHLVAARLDPADLPRVLDRLRDFIKKNTEEHYSSDEDEVVDSPYSRQPRTDRRYRMALQSAVVCLAKAIIHATEITPPDSLSQVNQSGEACVIAWAEADPCSCVFLNHRTTRRKISPKKLNFNEDGVTTESTGGSIDKAGGEGLAKFMSTPADSSGEESDTSDTSDCEFFTPPSSPGVRSDDEQAMESPDEGPDVYINGSVPSKLDVAVLEAIRGSEISKATYPSICRWRHLVMLHSQDERQSWASSPKPRLPSAASPMWHRTPSLTPSIKPL